MDWLSPIRGFVGFGLSLFEGLPFIRAILGFILVFFLPGFAWTLLFFKKINIVERVALSFGLSIALVTLTVFLVNIIGVRITGFNSGLVIIALIILPLALHFLNRVMRRRDRDAV
ncbi:DUF1616 domain-containing protein [Chloroflexota bacterium]